MAQRLEECVYCGSKENLTDEHVPPKLVFPKPHPCRSTVSRCIDVQVENASVVCELIGVGRVRNETMKEHGLGVATDLDVGENAVDGRIAQLRVAESLVAEIESF